MGGEKKGKSGLPEEVDGYREEEVEGVPGSMGGEKKGKSGLPEEVVVSASESVVDEEEEVQMEKFFSLLENVREMREQWRRISEGSGRQTKRPKMEEGPSSWTPTFQWEDFAGVANLAKSTAAATPGASEVGEDRKEEEEEETSLETLDLRLVL